MKLILIIHIEELFTHIEINHKNTIYMRLLSVFMALSISFSIYALKDSDSIRDLKSEREVENIISLRECTALPSKKDSLEKIFDDLQNRCNALLIRVSLLSDDSIRLRRTVDSLESRNETLLKSIRKSDTCLVNIASNFLYIPYEAYSDSIAILAFESVTDSDLKQEHKVRYNLLKDYRNDLHGLLEFLKQVDTKLRNPFVRDAVDLVNALHIQQFYLKYQLYDDWKCTYLGNKMVFIENQLNAYNGKDVKVDFSELIKELQLCLDTIDDL